MHFAVLEFAPESLERVLEWEKVSRPSQGVECVPEFVGAPSMQKDLNTVLPLKHREACSRILPFHGLKKRPRVESRRSIGSRRLLAASWSMTSAARK